MHVARDTRHGTVPNRQWPTLNSNPIRDAFLKEIPRMLPCSDHRIDERWSEWRASVSDAAEKCVPAAAPRKTKPWISEATLGLIQRRLDARASADWPLEKQLRKETQKSVRKDRSNWLTDLAGRGDWQSLRKLRQKGRASQTRLQNLQGETVSTELRAETLADHLEHLQWRVRAVTL